MQKAPNQNTVIGYFMQMMEVMAYCFQLDKKIGYFFFFNESKQCENYFPAKYSNVLFSPFKE